MGWEWPAPILAVAAVLAALVLSGCGGGNGGAASTSAGPTAAQDNPPAPQPSSQDAGSPREEASRGGEASIEDFGSEAKGAEREAILAVFTGYLTAIAEEDRPGACTNLAASVRESLARFAGNGAQGDCAESLDALLSATAPQVARQQANGEVTKVRVEGDRAFVIFKAPGAKLYQLTMAEEGGKWKAAAVIAAVLVPEL